MRTALLLLVVLMMSSLKLHSQEVRGTLYGTVKDETGLPLPGVTVTISSPQLSASGVLTTTESGLYRAPSLSPGTYTVKAEMQGFQTVTRGEVQLLSGAALAVDFVLTVATLEESVTVVGESPLVDVKSSQLQQVVGEPPLENIPTGRGFHDILLTMAGVTDGEYIFAPVQTVHGGSVRDNYNLRFRRQIVCPCLPALKGWQAP